MQEPRFPTGSRLSPRTQRKKTRLRQRRRTVFSAQQLRVLEEFFEGKPYGTYGERETLAAKLNLQEDQVQVWLNNRRAKDRRLQRLRGQQGQGAHATPQEPGVCAPQPAPAPVPVPVPVPAGPAPQEDPVLLAGPVLPAGLVLPSPPVFPEEPVFPARSVLPPAQCSPPRPCTALAQVSAAPLQTAPSKSSQQQNPESSATSTPEQGVQSVVLAAPAPAPAKDTVGPQGPYTFNFFPNPVVTPGYTELLSPGSPFEALFFSCTPWDGSDEDFYKLLDL